MYPLMRSCLIEIRDVCIEDTLELLLLQDQQVVQALLPHTSQEAFTDGIGSGSVIRGLEKLDATGRRYPEETGSKLAVVITNQIFGCMPIRGSFPKLLGHPGIRRGSCHAHVDHLARLQFDDEERKERSKEQIRDLEEVTRPDLCGVAVQKGRPFLAWWMVSANVPHVLLDSTLTHMHPQFQQFPTNALSTPKPILSRHLPDQGDGFRSYFRLVSTSL